jgi:putative transposase
VYQLRSKKEKERMILIVDNARIHRTKKLQEYCCKRKILIVYLPPYSPDLNPIELLRKIIKKEHRKIQRKYDDIRQ